MLATLEYGAAGSEGGLDRSLLKPVLSEDLDVEPPAPPGKDWEGKRRRRRVLPEEVRCC